MKPKNVGLILVFLIGILMLSVFSFPSFFYKIYGGKQPVYSAESVSKPRLLSSPLSYKPYNENYNNNEYSLPLKELPENFYQVIQKLRERVSPSDVETLKENGVIIISGNRQRFDEAYSFLSMNDVPIFITTDSVLHLYHIEFNEILKNLEVNKLSPMLKEFLKSLIKESIRQYNGFDDPELKELARRNVAYLSVAMKLLDPGYFVPLMVRDDVNEEIKRINDHKGFYKSPLFSLDCPPECLDKEFREGFAFSSGKYPDGEKCLQSIKGLNVLKIEYQGKLWDPVEFYREVCTKKCYCEDYSQYVPRGHYTQTEELKRYFKTMMWLGRMSFKVRGENWTKQAIILTDAVKSAKVEWEGKTYPAYEIWDKIYSITGFFAGSSDDLTFYEYDSSLKNLFGYGWNEEDILKRDVSKEVSEEIRKLRGPKILGGFEIDLTGNLKDSTQGLRLIGQRYALDSQILGDLVYKNVGPNINSPYYEEVIDYCTRMSCLGLPACSKPKDFYFSCENLEKNRTKYWNEVCGSAVELFCGCSDCSNSPTEDIEKLYSVCRFMPSGLDVASVLGSEKAEELLKKYYSSTNYCNYEKKAGELKDIVFSYSQDDWTKNLYNAWLWMLQPILEEKGDRYPTWMRSDVWKKKDLITALSSWAELRHDTILYVKQSYTWAAGTVRETSVGPYMNPKYYGYVEPNPELFSRARFSVEFLEQGLKEQGVITDDVEYSLRETAKMMEQLKEISEKELAGEPLTENDYNYIREIHSKFESILTKLTTTKKTRGRGPVKETNLEGEDAFKSSLIADVHTDSNSKRVLEVGTGNIDWILVAHRSKDGRIGLAVGPIFSYYEFSWPMGDRLTDEKWRGEVLKTMRRPVIYSDSYDAGSPYIIK